MREIEQARDAAAAVLNEWIAYALKIGENGIEMHVGNADGGAQNRFPQRMLESIKRCNGIALTAKRNDGGTSEASDVEAVRSLPGDDGQGPDAVRKARTGPAVRSAKGA